MMLAMRKQEIVRCYLVDDSVGAESGCCCRRAVGANHPVFFRVCFPQQKVLRDGIHQLEVHMLGLRHIEHHLGTVATPDHGGLVIKAGETNNALRTNDINLVLPDVGPKIPLRSSKNTAWSNGIGVLPRTLQN